MAALSKSGLQLNGDFGTLPYMSKKVQKELLPLASTLVSDMDQQ